MFEDILNRFNSKNIVFTLLLILFIVFIFKCKDIAMMFFACFVIACSLNPIVDKLSQKLPRGIATNIVTAGILLLILAISIPVAILAVEQIRSFVVKLPGYIDNLDEFIFSIPLLNQLHFLADDADNLMAQVSMSSSDILTHAIDVGKAICKTVVYTIISLIIIFNFIVDKSSMKEYFVKSFPQNMRKKAEEVGGIIAEKMGGFLTALVATSLSVGVVMLIGLLLFNVPYALLLAVIAAVLDIIPVVGPALAFIICFVAVYESGIGAIVALTCVFLFAQLVENNFVRPYVFGKVMHVHPVIIFLFLFFAAEYIGFVGVIFAPALAALVVVLFEELYMKKL